MDQKKYKSMLLIEESKLLVTQHEKILTLIFIQERIYSRILKMTSREDIVNSIVNDLEPFRKEIPRIVSPEDVRRCLLNLPTSSLSMYGMHKIQKEIDDINDRLKQIIKCLTITNNMETKLC